MTEKNTDDELHWRETYFIIFPADRRPTLEGVTAALKRSGTALRLENAAADGEGNFESVLIESDEDHAAVEVSFEMGDTVIEQNLEWAKELQDTTPGEQLQQLIAADARLDVAHFERMAGGAAEDSGAALSTFGDDEDAPFGMLDPTCLLTVVDALAQLTDGLTFDPAAGEVMP